jgi:hypothetical protein
MIWFALVSWASFTAGSFAGWWARDIYQTVFVTTRRGTLDLTHLSREKR